MITRSMLQAVSRKNAAGGGGGPVSITYQDDAGSGTTGVNFSFSSLSIGSARDYVLVVIGWANHPSQGAATISSATIGGSSATVLAQGEDNGEQLAILGVTDPGGTTATVALTFSQSAYHCVVQVFTMTGAADLTLAASDSDSGNAADYTLAATVGSNEAALVAVQRQGGVTYSSMAQEQATTTDFNKISLSSALSIGSSVSETITGSTSYYGYAFVIVFD